MVTADELRDMSGGELDKKLDDLREQVLKLRFQKTTGQIEDASKLTKVKRDIARLLTVQRERQLAEEAAAATEQVR